MTAKLGLRWDNDRVGYLHAELAMTINNGPAAAAYEGKVGTKWSMTITPAE
jgi:hypothetical protein